MAVKGTTIITIHVKDQKLFLRCTVYGSPIPKIIWIKKGHRLNYLQENHHQEEQRSQRDETHMMNQNISDRSNFSSAEDASQTGLNDSSAPIIKDYRIWTEPVTATKKRLAKGEKEILCSVRSVLKLKVVSSEYLGSYECWASNVHGSVNSTFVIQGNLFHLFFWHFFLLIMTGTSLINVNFCPPEYVMS